MPRSPRSAKPKNKTNAAPPTVHPNAGGIDIGATQIYVGIPPDRSPEPVRVFETFTEDLHRLARWLVAEAIDTVAMESTGVFWIPLFQILEGYGIKVFLVNARHVKNVPGRKTDVSDCQWLQYLHAVGLLRGSFRPADDVCAVRTLLRHRRTLVAEGATHIQRMQKSLTEMNIHLHHVLSDLSGVTGLAIIDAILGGQRDPEELADLRDRRVKASKETVCKALVGDWRKELLFTLQQARDSYRHCREQMHQCDLEIEHYLAELTTQVDPEETPPPPAPTTQRSRKGEISLPHTDLRIECYRILGVDITQVPGLGPSTVCNLVGELGSDLSDFPTGHHFGSWQALCPNPKISGGRVLRKGTRDVKHRVATLFRMAAQSLHHSDTALGSFYRRMRAKLGGPQAVTATAHKLARIYYHLVTTKQEYDETIFAKNEEEHQIRRLARIKREAASFGLVLASPDAVAQ